MTSRARFVPSMVAAGALIFLLGGAGQGEASIARLSWLAGCWESVRGERHVEEQWMQPRGGTMLGMSRTVVGGRASEFEQM